MRHIKPVVFSTLASVLWFMLCATAFANDDYVDYDHSADFNSFHTFQMSDTSKGALAQNDQIMDQRIHTMIVQHITDLGLKEVKSNPDLVVTYDASTKENHVLNTVGAPMGPIGIRFGGGWGRFGGMSTTTEATFTEGTLVIDAYVPSTKKMVWRGTAEAAISDNPKTTTKHIEKSLNKLFEKWEKIRKEQQ